MRDLPWNDSNLIFVRQLVALGVDDRQLRSAKGREELGRLRRGAYADRAVLDAATRDSRYDLRISAVLGTRRSPALLSHLSALRVWGLPTVNPWPWEVHLTVSPESARRSKNGVIVHRHALAEDDAVTHRGVLVTSLRRTLVDVARVAPFRDGVAAVDAALANGLVGQEELLRFLDQLGGIDGRARAHRAIRFGSPLAKLPGESFSRVLMHELGFPPPILQHEFARPIAGCRYADFWWPGIRLIGEFDGIAKYTDPRYTNGQSQAELLRREKGRENELRAHNTSIVRWIWNDLERVQPFIEQLEAAGLRRTGIRYPR